MHQHSTESYNDRLCIQNSTFTQLLSVEDTTACCHLGSMGCNGGQPTEAWDWFVSSGVVTGGDYDDEHKTDTCSPYTLPPCAHHVAPSPGYPACPSNEYPTPRCTSSCYNTGYPVKFSQDKHHAKTAYSLRSVSDIEVRCLHFL